MNNYDKIANLISRIKGESIENIIQLRMRPVSYGDKYLCPFHDDHTPNNFKINKKHTHYNCYACGANGNGITFIQEYDGISFKESVVKISYELGFITLDEMDELSKEHNYNKKFIPKETPKEKKEPVKESTFVNDIATHKELNSIYRKFMKGYSLIGGNKLSESHLEEIERKRNFTKQQIEEDEYFTFPDMQIMDALIEDIEKDGIDINLLKKIPGFYYSVPKQKWCFTTLKDTSGIGIPIKDMYENVIGIQIRLDEVSDKKKRYQWFSSSFANSSGKISEKAKTIYGTSPGAPIAVIKPKKVKNKGLFITEGYFKARTIANHYGSIALSVQGVTNWKNIVEVVNEIRVKGFPISCIYIAFDGDMCRKDTVMKPAIKMGLALTNLNFPEKINENIEKILKSSNRSEKEKVGNFNKESGEIVAFLNDNLDNFSSKIQFLLWNEMLGKGIDDIINAPCAIETIRPMELIDFWQNAYNLLSELDDIREEKAKATNVPFRKVVIEDEMKQALFKKHIDDKL